MQLESSTSNYQHPVNVLGMFCCFVIVYDFFEYDIKNNMHSIIHTLLMSWITNQWINQSVACCHPSNGHCVEIFENVLDENTNSWHKMMFHFTIVNVSFEILKQFHIRIFSQLVHSDQGNPRFCFNSSRQDWWDTCCQWLSRELRVKGGLTHFNIALQGIKAQALDTHMRDHEIQFF